MKNQKSNDFRYRTGAPPLQVSDPMLHSLKTSTHVPTIKANGRHKLDESWRSEKQVGNFFGSSYSGIQPNLRKTKTSTKTLANLGPVSEKDFHFFDAKEDSDDSDFLDVEDQNETLVKTQIPSFPPLKSRSMSPRLPWRYRLKVWLESLNDVPDEKEEDEVEWIKKYIAANRAP
jgi:hypothetical protein